MSRIGRQPIALDGTTFVLQDGILVIKGKRGELSLTPHQDVRVEEQDGSLVVSVANPESVEQRALWGLHRALIANMVMGVTQGFRKQLELNGVGFTVELKGKVLVFKLGFSHLVEFPLPDDVTVTVEKNVMTIEGNDRQVVGQVAAKIREYKKPEPYKGKGIKYSDEIVRRKAGKVVKAAG